MTAIPFVRDMTVAYGEPVTVLPGIRRVLARNPGPYTFHGTGTMLVGDAEVAVIDPGPGDPAHIEAVLRAAGSARVTHIFVTHSHKDHSAAAAGLKAATGAAVYGYGHLAKSSPWAEENDGHAFTPDIVLADGDRVEGNGWGLEAVHTPGHMSNHLCYALADHGILFTGDHVMGWATTLVSAPDGDMGAYMASLRQLMDRPETLFVPGHGPEIRTPRAYLAALLAHREEREAEILACLADDIEHVADIVARLYSEVDAKLHKAAGWSVEAHLIDLSRRGRVFPGPGGCWRLRRAA